MSQAAIRMLDHVPVAPAEDGSEEDDDNDYDSADGAESDEDGMETDGRLGTQHGYTSSQSTSPALEACIYRLHIRISLLPAESVESLTSMVHATEIGKPASGRRGMNQNPNSFLSSLMDNDTQQTIPSDHHDKAS
ncbi:hypothetical protein NC651_005325 [Populus alba x Populus x berolinensis]|nr:hypothetical protein NC651_005325 [Populus alba x Populus x berolinensis]